MAKNATKTADPQNPKEAAAADEADRLAEGQQLADPKSQGELVTQESGGLPAEFAGMEADDGAGMEDVGADEQLIPFITILQGLSPQVQRGNGAYVQGAEVGMIFNTATKRLMGSLHFLPIARDHNYVEYTPRDAGGGFHGVLAPNDPFVQKLKSEQSQFGALSFTRQPDKATGEKGGLRELVETWYLYVLVLNGAVPYPAMLAFKSTQIKKYKGLITFVNNELAYEVPGKDGEVKLYRPPLWAHRWLGTPVPESSKKGDFYGWNLTLAAEPRERALLKVTDPLYVGAKALYTSIKEGRARGDFSAQAGQQEADGAAM